MQSLPMLLLRRNYIFLPHKTSQNMINTLFISSISIFLISYFQLGLAQQPYIRGATATCESTDASTSVLGYTCNGLRPTCQAYLTFRAQPPFNSVPTVSALLSANSSQLAQLNSVPEDATFETDRIVLIPVTCSCSSQHSQSNTSYTVRQNDAYLNIASITFQGLSTCQALQAQNTIRAQDLLPGEQINVPLRCACPTQNQVDNGANYLLSYLIAPNQFLSTISAQFAVDLSQIRAANGLSETETNIYPNTTLLLPLRDPPTSTQATVPQPPPPPAATAPPVSSPSGSGSNRTWIYALVGVLGGGFLIGTLILCLLFYKKKKKSFEPVVWSQSFESVEKTLTKESNDEDDSRDFLESISSIAQSLKVYTFGEIKSATDDFSPHRLIKGSVYRGTINGDLAAIKRMNGDVSKEINMLNKINHSNLVRLSGVAFNEGNWYLVYEYASNGSLQDWILEKKIGIMNWNQRLQIAVDVAAGLNYIHYYTSPPYVHKDLNSANVLLGGDFRAKIANFRLARSAEGQEGQFALTRHIVGTKGYMAPEYLENGVVSPKLDVYAFGVLLLEILGGKEVSTYGANVQLLDILSEDESLTKLMDPALEGKYPQDVARIVFGLIGSCVKKDSSDRPSMDDVFKTLSRISTSEVSGEWAISISENQTRPG